MSTKLLTDMELRARWSPGREPVYVVDEGTILTPSAKDFIREHGITLRYDSPAPKTMTRTPIPVSQGKARFVEAATGKELDHKPEEMTHLRGNLLVPKTHPQIEFRGRLDSLMAQLMGVELVASEEEPAMVEDLEELMGFIRQILGAEVKDQPLEETKLLGLNSDQIRQVSHHIKENFGMDHPIPSYQMGRLCVALNRLRTQVREVELSGARAFAQEDGSYGRIDLIQGLNRLSSCVYILFCRKLSGYYDRGNQG